MSLSNAEKEMQCVLHWFDGWSKMQKEDFLKDLADKAVPDNVETLFESMRYMDVRDRPPSIFQCQLKLFTQWFDGWTDKERNDFMIQLQQLDPSFVAEFNEHVSRQQHSV
ncbi:hypothetical protein ACJMK2_037922 [Sinanodonta woodiana]|uniref:Uncharacterized protein n=1 Tax=Sinanodonta woodiana TaxID=1069815 RepID=A0ABD3WNT0_SINWO